MAGAGPGRQVQIWAGRLAHGPHGVVARHADDLVRGLVEPAQVNDLADRRAVRPVAARHGLVDDDHPARPDHVVDTERATLNDRDADGPEVVDAHRNRVDGRRCVVRAVVPRDPDPLHHHVRRQRDSGGVRHGLDAGLAAQYLERALAERRGAVEVVAVHLEIEAERRHGLRVEADVGAARGEEAACEERAGDQQHERQRQLHDDQRVSHRDPPRGAPRAASARAAERRDQIEPGGRPRGRQSEQECAQRRHARRKREHRPVEGHLEPDRHGKHLDPEPRRRAARPPGDRGAGRASRDRQDHTLAEQLADQAAPPGTERRPDGQLTLPRAPPGQEQVRDVGAGNQQDESRGDERRATRGGDDAVDHGVVANAGGGRDARLHVAVDVGVRGAQAIVGRRNLAAGLVDVAALGQPALHEQPAQAAPLEAWGPRVVGRPLHARKREPIDHRHRHPEVRRHPRHRPSEAARGHTDHGVRPSAQDQRAPEDVRSAPELALPHAMADDHDGRHAGHLILTGREAPPARGNNPQDVEVVGADRFAGDQARAPAGRHDGPHEGVRRHALERVRPLAESPGSRDRRS